jgi:hypothetical protein
MLHPRENLVKPTDLPYLKATIVKSENKKNLTVKEIATALTQGKTIIPAEITGGCSSKHWRSQQLFLFDLDNESEPRITVEDILGLCQQAGVTPCFIYETFSSRPEQLKMRIAFTIDKLVTDLNERQQIIDYLGRILTTNGQSLIDPRAKDAARIFFGTNKKILFESYESICNVDNIARTSNDKVLGHTEKSKNENSKNTFSFLQNPPSCNLNTDKVFLNVTPKTVNSYQDMIAYLTQEVSLHEYLGVEGKNFRCPFHDDQNPSAGIFKTKSGEWYFKCFACGVKGNIIATTEIIRNCGRVEAIKYLKNLYQITITESDSYILLQENLRMLNTSEIKENYSILYRVIKRYFLELELIHEIALTNLCHSGAKERAIFFFSNQYLAKKIKKSKSYVSTRVALLVFLKICRKLADEEVPHSMLQKAINFRKAHGLSETVQFYELSSFSVTTLSEAEEQAKCYLEHGGTIKGISREWILRTFGEDEANRVYPKQSGKDLPEGSNEFCSKVERILSRHFQKKMYLTEKQILQRLPGLREFNEIRLKRCIQQLMDKYGLIKVRATKQLKTQYNVKSKGYPNLIIRRPIGQGGDI